MRYLEISIADVPIETPISSGFPIANDPDRLVISIHSSGDDAAGAKLGE